MDYIDTMTDPEAIEREFESLLLDNERDWLLLDWGTLDTVIKCQKCGFDHVCSDRESAMSLMSDGCDMCQYQ